MALDALALRTFFELVRKARLADSGFPANIEHTPMPVSFNAVEDSEGLLQFIPATYKNPIIKGIAFVAHSLKAPHP